MKDKDAPLVPNAIQDIMAKQFMAELMYGIDNYPDGVSADFKGHAEKMEAWAQAAAKENKLTFAHLLLVGTYSVLSKQDFDELHNAITSLAVQLVQWREALDRRTVPQ